MSDDGQSHTSVHASESSEEPVHVTDKPYYSKRPHKKSRKGCMNCKSRKVKCDETRPACRTCRLRREECVYISGLDPSSSSSRASPGRQGRAPFAAVSQPSSSTYPAMDLSAYCELDFSLLSPDIASSITTVVAPDLSLVPFFNPKMLDSLEFSFDTAPPIDNPPFRPDPKYDELDLRLLWFYSIRTCESFAVHGNTNRAGVIEAFQSTVVQYAFQFPFLMDSIFALASLHMQDSNAQVDPQRAFAYRARSFEGYRQAIEAADPSTFPALLANSLILCGISSQTFREPGSKRLYIVDWMIIWKGIGLIIHLMGVEKLFECGLSPLFFRPSLNLDAASTTVPDALAMMISSIGPNDSDFADIPTYYKVLQYVGALYFGLTKSGFAPATRLFIITWLSFVPSDYVKLCQAHRPRALVILAYYAAFLRMIQDIWWVKGAGDRSISDIVDFLGHEWLPFLHAPLSTMCSSDRLEIARALLENPEWSSPCTQMSPDAKGGFTHQRLVFVDNHGHASGSRGPHEPT